MGDDLTDVRDAFIRYLKSATPVPRQFDAKSDDGDNYPLPCNLDSNLRKPLVDLLTKAFGRGNWSRDNLDKLVTISVWRIFKITRKGTNDCLIPDDEIQEAFDQFVDTIRAGKTALVPIVGLAIYGSQPLTLGDVQIHSTDLATGPLNEWLVENKRDQLADDAKEIFNQSGAYAVVSKLTGDWDHVKQTAITKVDDALHIIRLFFVSSKTARQPIYQKVGIAGIVGAWQSGIVLTQRMLAPKLTGFHGQNYRAIPYDLSADELTKREELIQPILKCFAKPSPSDFDKRIKRAVRWYGNSHNANTPEESYLAMAVALEGLLVADEATNKDESWGSITQKMAERVAFLLDEESDPRIKTEKKVKDLYRARNRVAHRGDDVSLQELEELDDIAYRSVIALAKLPGISNWKDFLEWITRQKYTTPEENRPTGR